MKKLHLVWFAVVLWMSVSCVSNRKIPLLQDVSEGYGYNNSPEFTAQVGDSAYLLRPYDVLSVRLSHVPLTNEGFQAENGMLNGQQRIQNAHPYMEGYRLNDTGEIFLPGIGKYAAKGKTVTQVQDEVQALAETMYAQPSVKVFLMNFNVSVFGEVRNPGRYTVYDHRINVMEAIGQAGGMDEFANRDEVKVIRTLADGSIKVLHVNLLDKDVVFAEGFYLKPNDVVQVKPLKRKAFSGKNIQWTISAMALVVSVIAIVLK